MKDSQWWSDEDNIKIEIVNKIRKELKKIFKFKGRYYPDYEVQRVLDEVILP